MSALTNTFGTATHAAVARPVTNEWQARSMAIEHAGWCSLVSNPLRTVGVLAFGQSFVFLLLWLLVCASAGAAPRPAKAEFDPTLQVSSYEPTKTRDPFAKVALPEVEGKTPAGAPITFQLDGILYSAANPSAIVNGHLLTLNKTVRLTLGGANISVKATAITRQQVTLEANGQKVELQLDREDKPARR